MKRSIIAKTLVAGMMALGVSTCAHADLLYTFDTGAGATTGDENGGHMVGGTYTWSSYYGGEVQCTTTAGGWNLGGAGPKFEFSWPSQSVMQGYANAGGYAVDFDIYVTDNSFIFGSWADWDWYQLHYAANSDAGWKQDVDSPNGNGNQLINGNYDATGTHGGNNYLIHMVVPFADMGWNPGTTWFQLFFGANSSATDPVQFYVDNISVEQIPEPGTLALAGLGAAALLIIRRRK